MTMYDITHANPELFAALAGECLIASPKYPKHMVTDDGRVFSLISLRFLRPMRCGNTWPLARMTKMGELCGVMSTGLSRKSQPAFFQSGWRFATTTETRLTTASQTADGMIGKGTTQTRFGTAPAPTESATIWRN